MKIRRWQYLLTSTALITLVITVGTGTYLTLVRQEKIEEMREAQDENEALTQQIDIYREQIRIMDERLVELEKMLLNLRRMETIIGGNAAPSRGGRQLTLTTMPLDTPSGYSAVRFERAFAGTGLSGIGEALVSAEEETGINALVLAGIIALESGYGSSKIARDKNNLAGLGAYSGSVYTSALRFDSREECVTFLADLLRDKYLTPGGKYYNGDNLLAVGKRYAEDPAWAAKAGRCMKIIAEAGQ